MENQNQAAVVTTEAINVQSKKICSNKNINSIADVKIPLQIFTKSNGILTKKISVDSEGKIFKDSSQCWMKTGIVKTVNVKPVKVPQFLDGIKSNQALALSNADYSARRSIVQKGQENCYAISRTQKYFKFKNGPAYVLFDIDFSSEYQPRSIESVLEDIANFIPEFNKAAKIIKPSTSSGIVVKGKKTNLSTGFHIYSVVQDASLLTDIKPVREKLLINAWTKGKGFLKISKAGSKLKRCPIDLAVLSPERLIFEAAPIISDGLEKITKPAYYVDGGYLL
ncbi:MAG: hypothetical protein KZQ83_18330 [gamma proteobacterium symbiont of Taylorina sp.]|nr:hypothetical protein [gamma proteobacterium symbiont of Taylorina sp.]